MVPIIPKAVIPKIPTGGNDMSFVFSGGNVSAQGGATKMAKTTIDAVLSGAGQGAEALAAVAPVTQIAGEMANKSEGRA